MSPAPSHTPDIEAQLASAVAALRRGRGGVLALQGPPGIGLSYRLNRFAAGLNEEVLLLRAAGRGFNPEPYGVWRAALAGLEENSDLKMGDLHAPFTARQFVRYLAAAVERARMPVVAIIDHWELADPSSDQVLELLETQLPVPGLLVILAGDLSLSGRLFSQRALEPLASRIRLVNAPDLPEITNMLVGRYPGAASRLVREAAETLIAHCGLNMKAILIHLRALEAKHPMSDVLTMLSRNQDRTGSDLIDHSSRAVGAPRQMITEVVAQLSATDCTHLGIWLLGAHLPRASLCETTGIALADLDAAISAGYQLGLFPTLWVTAADVHPLVTEIIVAHLPAQRLHQTHLAMAEQRRADQRIHAAIAHYLSSGPEAPPALLVSALHEGLAQAEPWRAKGHIAQYRQVLRETEPTATVFSLTNDTADNQQVGQMQKVVTGLVEQVRTGLGHNLIEALQLAVNAATAIADRADADALVAWSWDLRAVQALVEADAAMLEHCQHHAQSEWAKISAALFTGDFTKLTGPFPDPLISQYCAARRGEQVAAVDLASLDSDLFRLVLAAEITTHRGDRQSAAILLDRLHAHREALAVHHEGRVLIGPVASVAAKLAELVGDAATATELRQSAKQIAHNAQSKWLISSVTTAATRSVVARWGLSSREEQIATLLASGMTNNEIAAAMNYSLSTIRRGVAMLASQLAASDRDRLIAQLVELGFGAQQHH
jgi:DNA-binding CsgD family transcriptional regulator